MTKSFESFLDADPEYGALCLAYANTADWHRSQTPSESLQSYGDLVEWAQAAGLLDGQETQALIAGADARQQEAQAVLERAIALRESIYRIFAAVIAGASAGAEDLAQLNDARQEADGHLRLIQYSSHFVWEWIDVEQRLDRMLWPVAFSAVELLTSDRLERVKQCEDDRGCGYLFVDTSKNRSRRWCSMESCGNRAKVQRFRSRQHSEERQEAAQDPDGQASK